MQGLQFVYDIAFELEDDLNNLTNSFGNQITAPLINKIINVLEKLEEHAQHNDLKNKQIFELKATINFLENNKVCKQQEKVDQLRDLEKIEEAWHIETAELLKNIESLEEDNNNLRQLIQQASKKPRPHGRTRLSQPMEIKGVHLKLKETIDSQVEQLKSLKKDIAQKCLDIDAMQQQCLNLSNTNAEICENYCYSKRQRKQLMAEKSNLEARLLINSRRDVGRRDSDDVFIDHGATKMEGAQDDAHISWEEMKGYLQERDRLKSQVTVKKEELLVYKPRCVKKCVYVDDDAPVQGPINREPDDKRSPPSSKEAGIRRFFQRFVPLVAM